MTNDTLESFLDRVEGSVGCLANSLQVKYENPRPHFEDVMKLLALVRLYKAGLEFYAEPYTWARVVADYRADVNLHGMYGRHAEKLIVKGLAIVQDSEPNMKG